jgi:hypothetical protein
MSDNEKPNGAARPLPDAGSKSQQEWREFCAHLLSELDRLRQENASLREQRRAFAALIPAPEHVKELSGLPMEQLLAMAEFEPSLEEFIEQCVKKQGL